LIWRRHRLATVTVQADTAPGLEAATVVKALSPDLLVRITTMTTTRSDGWRPPVPIDDDRGGAEDEGAVRCIC
jgi:hypothetical protein